MAASLSQTYDLASLYHTRPSHLIGLTANDPASVFWAAAYDDLCARCKSYDTIRRQKLAEENPFSALVGRGTS